MNPLTIYLLGTGLWPLILGAVCAVIGLFLVWRCIAQRQILGGWIGIALLACAAFLLSSCKATEGLRQSTGYSKVK